MSHSKESLTHESKDPLIFYSSKAVLISVKILAVLMVIVIWLAMADVVLHMVREINEPPRGLFNIETLLNTLGNFLVVLIAIEVFLNVIFYLKKDAIHVPLVISTALTAIARKVIIFDFNTISATHVLAVAAVIFSLGLSYWLITKKE